MHNEPRQQLCKLIAQYGRSLCEDPRRCGALLKDHCGQYKREIFVLVNALENRVATELLNASAGVPEVILLSRLTKRLEDELGLTETAAKWAVESWALALGVISQPLPVSVPTPVQPTQPVAQSISPKFIHGLDRDFVAFQPTQLATHSISPVITASPVSSAGGKLKFPRFSVGKVKIGGKEQSAVGEIDVPQGQMVELKISEDVTDFYFLEMCDPNLLINRLCLSRCQNFDDGKLMHIKKFINLEFLDLSFCNILGHDFFREYWMNLKIIKNLVYLDLSGCSSIQNRCFNYISNYNSLINLNLSSKVIFGNIFVTDEGLKYLEKLNNLEVIDLSGFKKITGPGVLAHLGHMTQLKTLNLSECQNISHARLQELKQMLPNTRVLP